MKSWKKGAVIGAVWGFISWFGLGVAMSDIYISFNFKYPGHVLETLFSELVKVTLFLPAFIVVKIFKISPERDPVTLVFQNIALFPAVLIVGIILGSVISFFIEKYRTWRRAK